MAQNKAILPYKYGSVEPFYTTRPLTFLAIGARLMCTSELKWRHATKAHF